MRMQQKNTATAKLSEEQAPRKSLYLMGKTHLHIETDGTRLCIHADGEPIRPIPYPRISRIISSTNTHWHGQAIVTCLKHGIPIIWLDRGNHPIGDTHPIHQNTSELHHSLENYLDLHDWQDRYANWQKHRRMENLKHAILQGELHDWRDIGELKRSYVYQNQPLPKQAPAIHASCLSIVQQKLDRQATRSRYWGYNGKALEIANDLAQLIHDQYSLSLHSQMPDIQHQIAHFEHGWPTHRSRLEEHLADLKHHLQSENQTWQ